MPDELVVSMMADAIADNDSAGGIMLDGFPRTVPQAEALKEMLENNNKGIDKAILLDVSDEEVIKRLSGRFYCPKCNAGYNYPAKMPKKEGICDICGTELKRRPDDEEDVVRNRLEVYKRQTEPIVDFYRKEGLLAVVKAEGDIDTIYNELLKLMKEAD